MFGNVPKITKLIRAYWKEKGFEKSCPGWHRILTQSLVSRPCIFAIIIASRIACHSVRSEDNFPRRQGSAFAGEMKFGETLHHCFGNQGCVCVLIFEEFLSKFSTLHTLYTRHTIISTICLWQRYIYQKVINRFRSLFHCKYFPFLTHTTHLITTSIKVHISRPPLHRTVRRSCVLPSSPAFALYNVQALKSGSTSLESLWRWIHLWLPFTSLSFPKVSFHFIWRS